MNGYVKLVKLGFRHTCADLCLLAVLCSCTRDKPSNTNFPEKQSPTRRVSDKPTGNTAPYHQSTEEEAVKAAFKSWLKAAERKDAQGFKEGLSKASRALVEQELALPGEQNPYAGILSEVAGNADLTRIGSIRVHGHTAQVTYYEQGQEDTITMVREDGAWRVDLLSRVERLAR